MKTLGIGDPAPDFVVGSESGDTLHERIAKQELPALVYFYPADFSPLCTAQACMVRNTIRRSDSDTGIVIGVSPQRAKLHRAFQDALRLPQLLVADPDKSIGESYGAVGKLGIYRRVSYIIGVDYRVNAKVSGGIFLTEHKQLAKKYNTYLQAAGNIESESV